MPTHIPQPSTATPEPEHQRIRFALGATSATVDAALSPRSAHRYVLEALAGQTLIVDITAPHPVRLGVWGVDGTVLKYAASGTTHWEGALPSTQEYVLELASIGRYPTAHPRSELPARSRGTNHARRRRDWR